MKTIRIYEPGPFPLDLPFALSPEANQHVAVVLRMKVGDQLTLFCGDNHEYTALLTQVHKKHSFVQITQKTFVNRESPQRLHLAQGLAKGDKMEWIVQKAIELGVSSITPVLTQHGAVKQDAERLLKKQEQWQAIAISACEQSGRNAIPLIHPPCSLLTYLKTCPTSLNFILEPNTPHALKDYTLAQGDMSLLIGPEGGFHTQELTEAFAAGFNPLSLGPRILRTETAAIAALSILQAATGDL